MATTLKTFSYKLWLVLYYDYVTCIICTWLCYVFSTWLVLKQLWLLKQILCLFVFVQGVFFVLGVCNCACQLMMTQDVMKE